MVPGFILTLTFLQLVRNEGRLILSAPARWALALAVWALIPILWIDSEYLGIFVKEKLALWTQALMLIISATAIRNEKDWWRVVRGLEWMSAYIAIGGVIFVAGIWQGSFVSLAGRLIPSAIRESSAFFGSLSNRSFGVAGYETELLGQRVSSIMLHFSGLSLVVLLLIPFMCWRVYWARGVGRAWRTLVLLGLLICLVYAQSRIAYVAAAAGASAFSLLFLGAMHRRNRIGALGLTPLGVVVLAGIGVLLSGAIQHAIQIGLFELRPGSSLVRMRIYSETLALLPEHPIAGWGTAVRIPGMRNTYSAGSHSSYLGILFQHGVVGLVLYLGLWCSLWRRIIAGLSAARRQEVSGTFWWAMACAMLAFNIREAADTWTWDQSLTIVIWSMWGLVVSAWRVFLPVTEERPEKPRVADQQLIRHSSGNGHGEPIGAMAR